ncbi:MAG TPA: tetratricopeptide repeat protein [bacterium]|nr:tetratricopeptide repeat protein [bacterium]
MAEDKAVLIKTAYSYYQKGDWDRAIEEYHKLADLDPKDLNVHNMLADIYAKKGDVQEALQQYDLVAQGFDQKNQVDKVLQVYKRMLKIVPNDPDLLVAVKNLMEKYLTRASELEETESDKALEIYRSVIKAEPLRVEANLRLARLLAQKDKKFEGVETLLNLIQNLDPETQTGRIVEVLQAVIEMDPMNIEAREKLIALFIKARQNEGAVKSLQDLIEIYISKNDLQKAEAAAQKSIDLGDLNTFYHLGVIYFNQQKYQESRTSFERFLRQQEGHVGALKYLALSHLRMDQQQEAVKVYLRILDVYFNENLLDEAREVRQTIQELDPNNEEVTRYPLEQPVPVYEESPAQELAGTETPDPGAAEAGEKQALLEHAEAFTEKGFYEQAIDVYLEMLKRWPQMPEIRIRLQQVYALVAKAAEPAERFPDPEQLRQSLEKELREQMRRELEEQARLAQEKQREIEAKREEDQVRLKQELENKLLEQVQKSKEEDLRKRMAQEFEEDQRRLSREKELLEREKQESVKMAQVSRDQEESFRQQLTREYEERQKILSVELDRLEKEKEDSIRKMKQELEDTRAGLEAKLRDQMEREIREKLERETQREAQMKELMKAQKEDLLAEQKEKERFEAQKREQEIARAKINQEIHQGMERLRLEKEKASMNQKTPTLNQPPTPPQPVVKTAVEPQENLEDPFVRQTLADIYAKQGLYLEALKIYERILTEEPNNEEVREKLRDILRLKGI